MTRIADPRASGPEDATDFCEVKRSRNRFAGWSFLRADGLFSWMSPSGWYARSGVAFTERERAEAQLARVATNPKEFRFGGTVEFY